jgi:hypothetical protein
VGHISTVVPRPISLILLFFLQLTKPTYLTYVEDLHMMTKRNMTKNLTLILILASVTILGTSIGYVAAQMENNTNDTTAAVVNTTNASSSLEDAQNMSVIEGTMKSPLLGTMNATK